MTRNGTSSNSPLSKSDGQKTRYTFKKNEKLCYRRSFDILFTHKKSFNCGSLWVVYFFDLPDEQVTAPLMAAFAVPKRNFKKAPDRNLLKRRMREAFRLHKASCIDALEKNERNLAVLFKFNGRKPKPFQEIEKDLAKALEKLQEMA